jgi:hypothetical protein
VIVQSPFDTQTNNSKAVFLSLFHAEEENEYAAISNLLGDSHGLRPHYHSICGNIGFLFEEGKKREDIRVFIFPEIAGLVAAFPSHESLDHIMSGRAITW